MREVIQAGQLFEQAAIACQFLKDFSNPDMNTVVGMKECLTALNMGAIETLLLSEPAPDVVPGLYIDDLEEHVIELCERQNTNLVRIPNLNGVTNMFHCFGGIGGYLRWYIPDEELDPDLQEEIEITNLEEAMAINHSKPAAREIPIEPVPPEMNKSVKQKVSKRRKNSNEGVLYQGKENVNLVFCGHVDAGKSTTVGHLLLQLGQVDQRAFQNIQRQSEKNGRASWSYAYIMDTREDEQAKGITVESAYASFETNKRRYTIIDSPGHRDYLTNMIEGASQGDIAVLMLSARATEFEDGFDGGQTKEHARLARAFGMKRILLAVNKMDACDWSEDRFNHIVRVMTKFLKKELRFSSKSIQAVPISGVLGANLIQPFGEEEKLISWYENGPTLIDSLDAFKIKHAKKGDLRMTVASRMKKGNRVSVHGRVESGALCIGQEISIMPSGHRAMVTDIEIDEQSLKELSQQIDENVCAWAGDQVRLNLNGCTIDDISVGDLICISGEEPQPKQIIRAEIQVQNLLEEQPFIMKGYRSVFHCHNLVVPCEIVDIETARILQDYGEVGVVQIAFPHDVAITEFDVSKRLGSFVLRNAAETIALGRILTTN